MQLPLPHFTHDSSLEGDSNSRAEMEGERDNQSTLRNCNELNDENSISNCKKPCYQIDSSGCGESHNISNVAVTTRRSVNIANNEKADCEQPPKLELLNRLSGWMSQNRSMPVGEGSKELDNKDNNENSSSLMTLGTTRLIISTCHNVQQVSQSGE